MLDTALALLRERGNDDFTLQDVARQGAVSIGSIYYRFESKDELIRAVHTRTMQTLRVDELKTLAKMAERDNDLNTLVPAMVEYVSEMFKRHASSMAPMMVRAASDPVIASLGQRRYVEFADEVSAMLIAHKAEIRQPDPVRAVEAAYRIFYSTVARYLGLGMSPTTVGQGDWTVVKDDLADMILAYLKHAEPRR
jgi:AcrR family transcriptional regulator